MESKRDCSIELTAPYNCKLHYSTLITFTGSTAIKAIFYYSFSYACILKDMKDPRVNTPMNI